MSWRFWEKGARKNAAPIDPSKEMVNVDGKDVPLKELYDALPEELEKHKFNDDTILDTPKGERTMAELKQAYREKMNAMKKNAEEKCPTCGVVKNAEKTVPGAAGAEPGHSEHKEGEAVHSDSGAGAPGAKLPDLRHEGASTEGDPEAAAKKLDKETKEKTALELQQAEDDAKAKADEEKKNAEDKAKSEMKAAEDKAKEKELANAKKEAGRKSFAELKNAREVVGEAVAIHPVAAEERFARGAKKYGSAA